MESPTGRFAKSCWPPRGRARRRCQPHRARTPPPAQQDQTESPHWVARVAGLAIGIQDEGTATPAEVELALQRIVAGLGHPSPALLIIDDLQWSSVPLRRLLRSLGELSGTGLLMLALARPELETVDPDWGVDMELRPLPERSVATLVAKALGAIPEDMVGQLWSASGGNALYLTQLLAALRAEGRYRAGPPDHGSTVATEIAAGSAAGAA